MTVLSAATLFTLLLSCPFTFTAHGHGYLKTPRSRNYVAYEDGVWIGGTETTPAKESEPQSANRKAATATCGVISGRNYDHPQNFFGDALAPRPQACYQPGQIIDLEVTLTAHHKGHFEFKICPILSGEVPTQACFDENPMTFVSGQGANFDPNYPERAYIPLSSGNWNYSYKFKFPDGLSGDLVLLQWHYVTANSCTPSGYKEYNWPSGNDWHMAANLIVGSCGTLPLDGNGAPEQVGNSVNLRILHIQLIFSLSHDVAVHHTETMKFWNCAEIR